MRIQRSDISYDCALNALAEFRKGQAESLEKPEEDKS